MIRFLWTEKKKSTTKPPRQYKTEEGYWKKKNCPGEVGSDDDDERGGTLFINAASGAAAVATVVAKGRRACCTRAAAEAGTCPYHGNDHHLPLKDHIHSIHQQLTSAQKKKQQVPTLTINSGKKGIYNSHHMKTNVMDSPTKKRAKVVQTGSLAALEPFRAKTAFGLPLKLTSPYSPTKLIRAPAGKNKDAVGESSFDDEEDDPLFSPTATSGWKKTRVKLCEQHMYPVGKCPMCETYSALDSFEDELVKKEFVRREELCALAAGRTKSSKKVLERLKELTESGAPTVQRMFQGMSFHDIKKSFVIVAGGKDGEIGVEQFHSLLVYVLGGGVDEITAEHVNTLFTYFDADGGGTVNYVEFMTAVAEGHLTPSDRSVLSGLFIELGIQHGDASLLPVKLFTQPNISRIMEAICQTSMEQTALTGPDRDVEYFADQLEESIISHISKDHTEMTLALLNIACWAEPECLEGLRQLKLPSKAMRHQGSKALWAVLTP